MAYNFTKGQRTFINSLASKTGLSPRVLGAWVFAEMNGGAARSRESAGNHNWLNIAYFDSGPGSITKDRTWRSPESAAQATADFLRGKRFGPSSGIRRIIKFAGKSPEAQIQAIANSGWASSGYEGGSTLRNLYRGMSGLSTKAPQTTRTMGTPAKIAPSGGVQYDPSARQAAIANYIQNRNRPGALLALGQSLKGAESAVDTSPAPQMPAQRSSGGSGWKGQGLSPLKELIYTPLGYSAKNGQRTAPYAQANHYNHVHVAAGPKTIVRLGKRAQQMGLRVGENPAFVKVDPVHVSGSYHYRNQAIDVSGDAKKMAAFARYIARLYGVNK